MDQDTSFNASDYRELGERFFGPVIWTGGEGIAVHGEMTFELLPSDISLHVTALGPREIVRLMADVSANAYREGVVIIDIQGSELSLPLFD